MRLYVARHGQTQYNLEKRICGRADVELTDRGVRQAEELAEKLVSYSIDLIISSPLNRARKTAKIVGEKVGAPVYFEDRLMERDYGLTDGTYEGTPGFVHTFRQFAYTYPDGESLLQVDQRVYNFLDEVKFKFHDKNVLIVSHGGVCRVINSYFKSLSNEEFYDFVLDNCKVLEYEF